MNTIFTIDDPEDYVEKINLDDLYERKQNHDLMTSKSYNAILNRIHNRIKTSSRANKDNLFCWFAVPEVMIGVPKYDCPTCIAYVMDKLRDNGFKIRLE